MKDRYQDRYQKTKIQDTKIQATRYKLRNTRWKINARIETKKLIY